jgi:tetratricopeptide (TPR) repeat protein
LGVLDHHSGRHRLAAAELKHFQQLLWNVGAILFQVRSAMVQVAAPTNFAWQRDDFTRSLEWFERSYRLLDVSDTANQANYHRYAGPSRAAGLNMLSVRCVHRIIARCFMQLKQYDQALKHANEANIRESNLATHFLSFLIQLHVPDDEKGITTVR